MTWGNVAAGVGAVAGGLIASNGAKDAAKSSAAASAPWSGLQPYLRNMYGNSQTLAALPRQYYPGQTYVGALPSEDAAYGQRAAYNSMMFGAPYGMVGQWPSMPQGPAGGPAQGGFTYNPSTGSWGSSSSWGDIVRNLNAVRNAGSGGGIQPVPGSGDWQSGGPFGGSPSSSTSNATQKINPYTGSGLGYTPSQTTNWGSASPAGSPFGNTLGAMNQTLAGQGALGNMSSMLAPYSTGAMMNAFSQGAPTVGRYGFDTTLNPSALTPTFGQAGGLDARGTLAQMMSGQADWGGAGAVAGAANSPLSARPDFRTALGTAGAANAGLGQFGTAGNLDATGAIQKMLSGQGDYGGLQGAIDAANAPILRQFEQDILPELNQRATFLSNETGGIKTLNRVLPEIGQRMSQNAAALTEGERQRALGAQQQAAGLVSQGGLAQGSQASSQLFGAGQSALDRAAQQASQMASQNYGAYGNAWQQAQADRGNAANLVSTGGLSAYGLGLQGATTEAGLRQALAGMNLQTDTTNAGLWNQYRGDLLGLGSLAGGLAGDQSTAAARWGALFPSLAAAGQAPSSDALAYGGYQRGIMENALGDQVNRWNYTTQEPYERMAWLNSILQNNGGGGGAIATPNSALSTLGGVMAGAQLGGMFGNAMGGMPNYGGTMNSQGFGLSQNMLNNAYGQLDALALFPR